MEELYYIGLDLHKKIIAYCIKTVSDVTVSQKVGRGGQVLKYHFLTPSP